MKSIADEERTAARRSRQPNLAIKQSLRELRNQLSMLNHQIGIRVDLKDIDLDCLDLIARNGPQSPSALAQTAGLHPATMTGILDRLERGGWVVRERDTADRRGVLVRAAPSRVGEVGRLYSGMNGAIDKICGGYAETELKLIGEFLHRMAEAGRAEARVLAEDE